MNPFFYVQNPSLFVKAVPIAHTLQNQLGHDVEHSSFTSTYIRSLK